MSMTVSELNIYPVKGLKGIALEQARCTERGLENDRRWMVVDRQGTFLSQRTVPKMATVWTELYDDALALSAPDMDVVEVPLATQHGERRARGRLAQRVRCRGGVARRRCMAHGVPRHVLPPRAHARNPRGATRTRTTRDRASSWASPTATRASPPPRPRSPS